MQAISARHDSQQKRFAFGALGFGCWRFHLSILHNLAIHARYRLVVLVGGRIADEPERDAQVMQATVAAVRVARTVLAAAAAFALASRATRLAWLGVCGRQVK